jgi:hypothetical protein
MVWAKSKTLLRQWPLVSPCVQEEECVPFLFIVFFFTSNHNLSLEESFGRKSNKLHVHKLKDKFLLDVRTSKKG